MKYLLFSLVLINSICKAQHAITERLQQSINGLDHIDEQIPIRIEVLDKVDAFELHKSFIENDTELHLRAVETVKLLQVKAQSSQENILKTIKNNESHYSNIRSYWIINHIYLNASSSLIYLLSQREDIALVDLDADFTNVLEPFKEEFSQSKTEEFSAEIGIDVINARALWDMGYTGKGLLVYDFDTGVWPDHPTFNKRFLANRFPENQAWYGHFRDFPNGIISNHGTHTLGTMIGEGLSSGDTVGIAPKTYWMACDLVTSTVEELPSIEAIVGAYQWALDTDNNPETTNDIPDVINNSWRWRDNPDTVHCNDYIVDLMNALEAVGIASVFSGGNAGPNNTTISAPQRINTTIVNTFSVGSINANSESLSISNFSSRGPLQCPANDSSLLIHPEVVAPGQQVRSSWGQNTFNSISGTSMAAPHVSGAVLLLKEAFPYLSGADILTALYYTATDMGISGEDNTYGMGLINCLSAFNYLCETNTPVDPIDSSNDIEITQFNSPNSNLHCNNIVTPSFRVKNHSVHVVDSLKVTVNHNQSLLEEFMWYGNIDPESHTDITLNSFSIDEIDTIKHELQVLIECFDWEEVDNYNNALIKRFNWHGTRSTPLIENFESQTFSTNHWKVMNSDGDETWDIVEIDGLNQSTNSARVRIFYYDHIGLKDHLVSQAITIDDNTNYLLYFDYAHNHRDIGDENDSLYVEYSTDCGLTFENIFREGGEDLATSSAWDNDFEPQDTSQWKSVLLTFDSEIINSSQIILRFSSVNGKQNNLYLDNITFAKESEFDLIETTKTKINLYPNPSNGTIMVTRSENDRTKSTIEVLDIRGRKLYYNLNWTESKKVLKLNHLNPGSYILRLTNADETLNHLFIIE